MGIYALAAISDWHINLKCQSELETTERKYMKKIKENIFSYYLTFVSILIVVLFLSILITLVYQSFPSIKQFGMDFYTKDVWNPVSQEFGSLSFLVGTLITSLLAILIAIPFSIMISIFLGEYFKEGIFSNILKSMVELLAGIPSIVYGIWGLFVFVPFFRGIQMYLVQNEIMNIHPFGRGIFTASIILTVMIIPYAASIGRDVISMVPNDLKEAGYSLGGTRFEVIKKIILPYCKSGIIAGILLALGRALGETMAVTMVIGNRNVLPKTIMDPSSTLASVLANEFGEATNLLHLSSLVHLGLVLFLTTAIVNIAGKAIINRGFRSG